MLVVALWGLVLWAGEVAHAVESTAQLHDTATMEGSASAGPDDAVHHLDEGAGGRRGDVEPSAVIPTLPDGAASDGAIDAVPAWGVEPHGHHLALPGVRGPPCPT